MGSNICCCNKDNEISDDKLPLKPFLSTKIGYVKPEDQRLQMPLRNSFIDPSIEDIICQISSEDDDVDPEFQHQNEKYGQMLKIIDDGI